MTSPGHFSETTAGVVTSLAPSNIGTATALRYFQSRPRRRRVAFVLGYEVLSVLLTVSVLSGLLGHGGASSTLTAVLLSTSATLWNYGWNTIYEAFERRTQTTGRGALARAIHAIGYEGGVLVVTIPIVAIMLNVSVLEALIIECSMLVVFLLFTLVYTWVFDRIFGLPASAL